MRYFKVVENGELCYIGTGPGGIEITKQEYDSIIEMMALKTELEEKLYAGEITAEYIPEKWRAEIVAYVEGRKKEPEEPTEADRIADMEAALRVLGVIENEDV